MGEVFKSTKGLCTESVGVAWLILTPSSDNLPLLNKTHAYMYIYIYIYINLVLIKINSQSKHLDLHFYLNQVSTDFSGSITQVKSLGSSPHFEQYIANVWPESWVQFLPLGIWKCILFPCSTLDSWKEVAGSVTQLQRPAEELFLGKNIVVVTNRHLSQMRSQTMSKSCSG